MKPTLLSEEDRLRVENHRLREALEKERKRRRAIEMLCREFVIKFCAISAPSLAQAMAAGKFWMDENENGKEGSID